jgi:hypothetical protein
LPPPPSPPPARAVGRALPSDREVLGIMESWFEKPDARFVLQCKLYTDTIINSRDPKIIHMLFIQAVYNVITGAYPTNEKDAVQLAAWQFQAKFGGHNPSSHKPGFLSQVRAAAAGRGAWGAGPERGGME